MREHEWEQNQDSKEKVFQPELLTGQKIAEISSILFEKSYTDIKKCLGHSNVILTIAGLKGETSFALDLPSDSDEALLAIRTEVDDLNRYLKESGRGLQFSANSEPFTISKNGEDHKIMLIGLHSLIGFQNISKTSKIPGVEPFFVENGFDGLMAWKHKLYNSLAASQANGQIPAEYSTDSMMDGIRFGYPDQAVWDFAKALSEKKLNTLVDSRIGGTGTFDESQPNFDYFLEHAGDKEIVEYKKRAEEILREFYASDFGRKLLESV